MDSRCLRSGLLGQQGRKVGADIFRENQLGGLEPAGHHVDPVDVVCAACKAHVSEALTAKLPGVEKIDITKGEKEGVNTITIVSKDSNVTKDTAMAALGDLAQNYQITSLAKRQ